MEGWGEGRGGEGRERREALPKQKFTTTPLVRLHAVSNSIQTRWK